MAPDPLSAAAEDEGPRRALVLAGGGMRVAWQAGALVALQDAGLRFAHADGTSGGTMNLAMLLSGLAPREMAERWRTLDVRGFVAPPPPRAALRLAALGGSRGVRRRVFPHLGIDPGAVRSGHGMTATFNVCDHATKACVAVPREEVDLDVLVAGITLPLAMPAVPFRGGLAVDAVWVKDANLMECVRRGAEELWVLWCIGNTAPYRGGPLQQYVHMIEQSANGVLFEELDRIRDLNAAIEAGHSPYGQQRPIVVHVVRPRHPLPLDPDLLLGRIDAGSLVAMGFRDALEGLAAPPVALGPSATAMEDPGVRAWWREAWAADGLRAELHVDVPGAGDRARLCGRVVEPGGPPGGAFVRDGAVVLDAGGFAYRGELEDGRAFRARRGAAEPERLRPLELELDGRALRLDAEGAWPPRVVVRGGGVRRRLAAAARLERLVGAEAVAGRRH